MGKTRLQAFSALQHFTHGRFFAVDGQKGQKAGQGKKSGFMGRKGLIAVENARKAQNNAKQLAQTFFTV